MTLRASLATARDRLIGAGIIPSEASIDVDLFARTILGWDRARLLTNLTLETPAGLEPRFSEWLERRERREPTAYIVGWREFWGLEFLVSPAVLIPRPETEFIVEEAALLLRATTPGTGTFRIADIGTGSGCIAVSLAHEIPNSHVVATDVSAEALSVAKQNAARHGVGNRVTFVPASYLDTVDGDFDLIAANPPYVRDRDKRALSTEVRHEPDVALFGGDDGLRHLDAVLAAAVSKLRAGGWLVMEFGFGQEDDVLALVPRHPGLRVDHVRADLQGLARTVIIQKAQGPRAKAEGL